MSTNLVISIAIPTTSLISFYLAVLPDLSDEWFERYDLFLKSCKNGKLGYERYSVNG
jgi:hypothetical protein